LQEKNLRTKIFPKKRSPSFFPIHLPFPDSREFASTLPAFPFCVFRVFSGFTTHLHPRLNQNQLDESPSPVELYLMNDDAAAKAAHFGAEFIYLEHCSFPPELLARIPAVIARSYQVLPLDFIPQQPHALLKIAISDPSDLDALEDLCRLLHCELMICSADAHQLRTFITKLYPLAP